MLEAFDCKEDDPNRFLKEQALECERNNVCRTYLALDAKQFKKGVLSLVAYFAISITQLDMGGAAAQKTDATDDHATDDHAAYDHAADDHAADDQDDDEGVGSFLPAYLIAQLARNRSMYSHDDYDGVSLLSAAEELIVQIGSAVGGELIILDCKDELVDYYEKNGYVELQPGSRFHRMAKGIPYLVTFDGDWAEHARVMASLHSASLD